MPIPKEVLAVKRPTNTVVIVYGKNKDLYAVRQRVGCKNVNGRHIPITGPTVGHIVDGVYIPKPSDRVSSVSCASVDLKDWANVVLCDSVFRPILDELKAVYNECDALKIYCIALLRVCYPGIADNELKEMYDTGFLSELYPDTALSKNTVSSFLNNLGKACSRITRFMKTRADSVRLDHHLLVDGTLKADESKVNSLSDFSYKYHKRNGRDISVIYAFDLEASEPICSKCFPGNMLDVTSYENFISENGIKKGIIVADKGFPSSAAADYFALNPDMHYINPIKRNSKMIERHDMLDFTDLLPGYKNITFRKEKCSGVNKWLYSFRDACLASKEEIEWLNRAEKEGNYDQAKLREKQRVFGTIVLESDLDLPPETAYKAYSERWEIELVMRYYKSACEFDETRVQDDYSVIGSEFCDFLATLLTFRLLKVFGKAELFKERTYKKIMSILTRAKKVKSENGDWALIKMNSSHIEILQSLELIPRTDEPVKRKRGRPPKVRI